MERPDSINYSWKYVTADECLSTGACELVYAKLTPATAAGSATLYNGENDKGVKIIELNTGGLYNCECAPPVPIYCRRGLYVGSTSTIDGVLVIWRELGRSS